MIFIFVIALLLFINAIICIICGGVDRGKTIEIGELLNKLDKENK